MAESKNKISIEDRYVELLGQDLSDKEMKEKLRAEYEKAEADKLIDEYFDEDDDEDDKDKKKSKSKSSSDKKGFREGFFDTSKELEEVDKLLRGEFRKEMERAVPFATDEFISYYISNLRSIIKTSNIIADMEEEQIKEILWEKNIEFIDRIAEEDSVEDEDVEFLINTHDHHLQVFLQGLIKQGQGAEVASKLEAEEGWEAKSRNKEKEIMFKLGPFEAIK